MGSGIHNRKETKMEPTQRGHWVLGVLVLALLAPAAGAQDNTNITVWQHDPATAGCWMVPDNWTHGVPAERTAAFITNGGTALVHDSAAGFAPTGAVAGRLFLGGMRNGRVEQTGGSMTLGDGLWLGRGRAGGYYDLSGGSFATTNAYIGSGILANVTPWRPSRFLQSGGTSVFEGTVHVGLMPWAVPTPANVQEPEATDDPNVAPRPPYHNARLVLTDGHLTAGRIAVGYGGKGDVIQTGGGARVVGGLYLGGRMVRLAPHADVAGEQNLIVRPYGGGSYTISDGALSAGSAHVGHRGDGRFVQRGGAVEVESVLRLGGYSWHPDAPAPQAVLAPEVLPERLRPDSGTYALADGELKTQRTDVGLMGYGLFMQSGGFHGTAALRIGVLHLWPTPAGAPDVAAPDLVYPGPVRGRYVLRGGELNAGLIELGGAPVTTLSPVDSSAAAHPDGNVKMPATFVQHGGEVETHMLRVLGGAYEMSNGTLTAGTASLTHGNSFVASSRFLQRGGAVTVVGALNIGTAWPTTDPGPADAEYGPDVYHGAQIYSLAGGELAVGAVRIGGADRAMLVQTGGALEARQIYLTGREGVYDAMGGKVRAGAIHVGVNLTATDVANSRPDMGTLRLGARARVAVTDRLVFARAGQFRAAEGSTIHMDGADFENYSTRTGAVDGLDNLRMVFTADPTGTNRWQTYEVAGKDLGLVRAGWYENFVMDTLQLGMNSANEPGYVRLVDEFDNQPGFAGAEALYLRHLIIGPGSRLDLNGLNIYYFDLEMGDGAEILDGTLGGWTGSGVTITLIPEPATLMILGLGAVVSLIRRK